MQNFAFKINRDVIIRVVIYILISLLLLVAIGLLNIYFSYKARIIRTVNEIPDEISAVIVIIDELSLDKNDELIVIVDDLKSMKNENKIDKFFFFVQKREDTFPSITALNQRLESAFPDTEVELTTKSTKSICGEILESGVTKSLIISPQSQTIFNTYTCNLSDMYAIGYYPNIKNINLFNGYFERLDEVITAPRE